MFHTANSDALRAVGLTGGHVWVSFVDDALELRGDTGGVLRIGPGDFDRARIGYVDARGRYYHAKLWRAGASEPLVLVPSPGSLPAYTRSMLALAGRCDAERRIGRIERGSTRFEALFPAALLAPVVVAALAVGALYLTDQPWWTRTLVPLIPMILFGYLLRRGLARHWPTALRDAGELRPMLPPLG